MNKQNFLSSFYQNLLADLLGCVDIILYDVPISGELTPFSHWISVCKELRKRPDIFRNVVFMCRFVFLFIDELPICSALMYSSKVSPSWLSNLLILKQFIDECKENN